MELEVVTAVLLKLPKCVFLLRVARRKHSLPYVSGSLEWLEGCILTKGGQRVGLAPRLN